MKTIRKMCKIRRNLMNTEKNVKTFYEHYKTKKNKKIKAL
ncbi:MAG: hypothetical protein BAJALOKI1v1_40025 [Promethearchaeota archaeon]|nr:MAG: hypothetical protein BAJALOKI1v1_40025 [Candidatus Lokiarchaeota archaeon]